MFERRLNHLPATSTLRVRRQRRHADCDLAAWSAAGPGSRFHRPFRPARPNVVVQAIITLANDVRGQYGVGPLTANPALMEAAVTGKTWPWSTRRRTTFRGIREPDRSGRVRPLQLSASW